MSEYPKQLKDSLRELLEIKKEKRREEEELRRQKNEEDRNAIIKTIGSDLSEALKPVMKDMTENSRISDEQIRGIFKDALQVSIPEIKLPKIRVPDIKIPDITVNVPPIKVPKAEVSVKIPPIRVPDVIMPDEMNVRGWLNLIGWDKSFLNNPLPVQLRDASGNPVKLFETLTQIGGGGGGGFKNVVIGGINQSAWGRDVMNPDNRIRVSMETGGGGLTDTELRASSVPVEQVSGSTWSVSVNDIFRTTAASNLINSDDRLRVSLETGGSGLTDAELRATAIPVSQLSGATWSVSVNDVFRTTAASTLINSDDRLRVSLETGGSGLTDAELRATAVPVSQLSGAAWSVYVPDSVYTHQVSGANWSVSVTENKAEDAAHVSGDTGIMALTVRNSTNTTFAADGDYQPIATDGIGRVLMRPIQVRGYVATAYVSLATGSNFGVETALLTGQAGFYHDLIWVFGANDSDAAVSLDIRATTGGSIIGSLRLPANGTAGISTNVPWPGPYTDHSWTIDAPDISGTNVVVTGLFSKEV